VENYGKIMGLVEEVRDILDLHEKLHHATKKKLVKKFGASTSHNPFKNIAKGKALGPTRIKKVKGRTHAPKKPKDKKWKCRCSSYQCHCMGYEKIMKDGKPTKKWRKVEKAVHIDRIYKGKYNVAYKKWRASEAGQKHLKTVLKSMKKSKKHAAYKKK